MTASKTTISADDILQEHADPVRELAEELRGVIHDSVGGQVVKAYPAWGGIGFRHPHAGYVCEIFPLDDKVRLLFEDGNLLLDLEERLKGDGNQTRYVEIYPEDDVEIDTIRRFLLEAISLRRGRKRSEIAP